MPVFARFPGSSLLQTKGICWQFNALLVLGGAGHGGAVGQSLHDGLFAAAGLGPAVAPYPLRCYRRCEMAALY